MTCTCPDTGWPNPDCPAHGLRPGQAHPPMDRHALPGEDARAAQRRLYLASVGKVECRLCGRVGSRQFSSEAPPKGRTDTRYRCTVALACGRRARRRDETARSRLAEVRDAVSAHRFVYGNERDLQAALAAMLSSRWAVVRERPLSRLDRLDLYLPALRVGIETKLAGSLGGVLRQCGRYLDHPEVDALLLVTRSARHELPAELFAKPVAAVWLGASAL